ncbi:MAG: sensor histidine kinase [Planctomycetota bacterium]
MSRAWLWPAYWIAGAVLLAALVWISRDLLDANYRARYESELNVALSRMDSQVQLLLAREQERDPDDYTSLTTIKQQTYTKASRQKIQPEEILRESQLLMFEPDAVRLHFQVAQDGTVSSPQVPTGIVLEEKVPAVLSKERFDANCAVLDTVQSQVDPKQLGIELKAAKERKKKGRNRQWISQQPSARTAGAFEAMWIDKNLYFVRKVKQDGVQTPQGFVVDWTRLRQNLLDGISGLFPAARLEPYLGEGDTRSLFTLPARLEPGAMANGRPWSMEHLVLAGLWFLVVGAYSAHGVTLRRSERQRRFASHVTHELRSPLTTFSLYSDLLAEGMVQDEDKRTTYLQTLQAESQRMNHMIENVIAQARLEEGRAPIVRERVSLGAILEEIQPALSHSCERSGLQMSIDPGDARDTVLHVDRAAVGRILTNLAENACKYAADGNPPILSITASVRDGSTRIRMRDHGPGIAPDLVRSIFQFYDRGGRDETDPIRGLGLGLPLSKNLARQMGGDLSYETPNDGGACFVLSLPIG